jgi:hypothetical protein
MECEMENTQKIGARHFQPAVNRFNTLLRRAQDAARPYLAATKPSKEVEKAFVRAVDTYAAAFRAEYPSTEACLMKNFWELSELADAKGKPLSPLKFRPDLQSRIETLDSTLYRGGGMYDRQLFAQVFVIELPDGMARAKDWLHSLPDQAPAAQPNAPHPRRVGYA